MSDQEISLIIIEDISGNTNQEQSQEHRQEQSQTHLNSVFSVGQAYPRSFKMSLKKRRKQPVSSNKRFKKANGKKKEQSQEQSQDQEQSTDEEMEEKKRQKDHDLIIELMEYFEDVNPYYLSLRISYYVMNPPQVEFSNKDRCKSAQTNLLIPRDSDSLATIIAYNRLSYMKGTLFDWHLHIVDLDRGGTVFKVPQLRKFARIKSPIKPLLCSDVHAEADRIFQDNQWTRWQIKRLVSIWLTNKSKKRVIGADCDIITSEPIPPNEQIRIISIRNRTEYVFSGHVLLKTAKSCLEGQVIAIPNVKSPHNPYTNTPFSYGEMVEVYNGILRWCAKKSKPLPAIIALYREHRFRNNLVLMIHNNYIQMKATESFMYNDDMNGDFFIEIMQILLEDFSEPLLREFNPVNIAYQRFRLWNKMEPKNYLLICWKKLAADFWYYKQTEQFPRENWKTESSIFIDVVVLLRSSADKLRYVSREYYRIMG